MKFLSPRPQKPKLEKDRLGNTIPPSREPPFAVTVWATVFVGIFAGCASRFIGASATIHNDFWLRVTASLGALISYGALFLLNRGLNRCAWYRDFKRSPLLINGTHLILVGIALFICCQALAGKSK